jgi:hypothetical protein
MRPSEAWAAIHEMQEVMAANERMGAALAFIYREAPEWEQRVAEYLADYPLLFDGLETLHSARVQGSGEGRTGASQPSQNDGRV